MTEKEINAYKKITAPSSIKERLLAESKKTNKHLHLSTAFYYGVATVAAMVVIAFTLFWNNGVNLYFNGEEIGNKEAFVFETPAIQVARAFSASRASIPLEIKSDTKAEITVSSGVIVIDGEDMGQKISVTEDTSFIWTFNEPTENDEYILEVTSKKERASFKISKKKGTERFYIKKVN